MRVGFFPIEGSFGHFGDDVFDLVGNLPNFGGFLAKTRIWSSDDFH